jgi:hypothetical protein
MVLNGWVTNAEEMPKKCRRIAENAEEMPKKCRKCRRIAENAEKMPKKSEEKKCRKFVCVLVGLIKLFKIENEKSFLF